jgi:MFS family permease
MRSAPRDALVAQSADELNRGKAFGLEGVGDNLGAFLGPLVTIVLMYTFSVSMRWIFYLAIVPGALSVVMILLVKESPFPKAVHSKITIALNKLPGAYWKYLAITAVFGLGNSSNAFLILRTKDLGIPLSGTIGMYAVFNLIAALASYPSGFLSDKFGRKNILLGSFFIYFVVYVGFALSQNALLIAILFSLYGMFQGAYRTVGKAFASDFVPQHLRASSIGWYSTTVGLSGLFASIVAGLVWDSIGHSAVFFLGSGFALLGCITLLLFVFEATTRPTD